MKNKLSFLCIVLIIVNLLISCDQTNRSRSKNQSKNKYFKESYLDQKPPGMVPEVFAPGIISKTGNHLHSCVSFSPNGKEIYFTFRAYEPEITLLKK